MEQMNHNQFITAFRDGLGLVFSGVVILFTLIGLAIAIPLLMLCDYASDWLSNK